MPHRLVRLLPAALLLAALPGASSGTLGRRAVPGRAGGIAARVAAAPDTARDAGVVPGVEVLLADSLGVLRGKRVGLITNHTGRDRAGTSTIDLLARAPGVRLVALFGPEHGIRGTARGGDRIASSVDSATGLPVYSLYGKTLVPTPAMLRDVDVLVYDIQDVGARPYTFVWTMALAAQAAHRPFVVLDRPDPIRDDIVAGGVLDTAFRSFVGRFPVAMRYGLTPGELLRWLVGTHRIDADITVIPMRGYRRAMWWDETRIPWVPPSPNIRTPTTALLYPGTVFFEAVSLSEGRGTDAPLEQVGAPWLDDAGAVARAMNAMHLPGVRFDSVSRHVAEGEEWGGRTIPMVRITVTDRNAIRPVDMAVRLMREIYRRHPRDWRWRAHGIEELSGGRALRRVVEHGGVDALLRRWHAEAARFAREVRRYRLYPE